MRLNTPLYWRQRGLKAWVLYPLSFVFRLLVLVRRGCYRSGLLSSWQSPVPVVVVGNLTAGGAGKTPLVIALVEHLKSTGKTTGVVTRGYGGTATHQTPVSISENSDPLLVGDEAILLSRRSGVQVVACRDRPAAIKHLLSLQSCDVIICDDGLQHYAMQRDIEIIVIDSDYRFGNGFCLPAGPLREPLKRVDQADLLVYSGTGRVHPGYQLLAEVFVRSDKSQQLGIKSFINLTGASGVHAVAAIALPEKFFTALSAMGLKIFKQHSFPDHHSYTAADLQFNDDLPVVMTEKDCVKCESLPVDNMWFLKVSAQVDEVILDKFDQLISRAAQRVQP